MREAVAAFNSAASAGEVEQARIEYLGQRQGRLQEFERFFKQLAGELKRSFGQPLNQAKKSLKQAHQEAKGRTGQVRKPGATRAPRLPFDFTLPGLQPRLGKEHPLTQTAEELVDLLGRFGFSVADGPEVEDEWHNFEALNIPPAHPARDPQENFYIDSDTLLRSQTSTVQIRMMEQQPPPLRVISIGRVYRPDTTDATHSCMFHQIEGLYVDRSVTLADLKTVLRLFVASYLGGDVRIRFRPSFFPFTEPSVEVDMSWDVRGGQWVELGGAGMVDPNVFRAVGYDPEKYSGFAFGLGIERLCMRRHGINDIRLFFDNDLRFLGQF